MSAYRFQVIHATTGGCGKPAFLICDMPEVDQLILSNKCAHLDESPVVSGSTITCDSCGGTFPIRIPVNCVVPVQ